MAGLLSLSIRTAPLHGPLHVASTAEELDFLPRISGLLQQHRDNEAQKGRIPPPVSWGLLRVWAQNVRVQCASQVLAAVTISSLWGCCV